MPVISATKLRCEDRETPLAIDKIHPRLSWVCESSDPSVRGQMQTAYRIIVADSSWKTSSGPLTESDIQDGDRYDARMEKTGWDKPGSRATPTLHDGKLYLLSAHGLLGCRSATDGRLLWSRRMSEFGGKTPQWGYTESVLIHGGKAIISPGGEKCIVALDPDTGRTVWTSQGLDIPAEYGSCTAIEREPFTLLVGVTSRGLVAVRLDNGGSLWPLNITGGGSQDTSTPVFADDHLFWAGGHGKGATCLRLADDGSPTVAWTTGENGSWHLGDFVIDRGHVYGHLDRNWVCLDLKTGEEKWIDKGIGRGAITWADGMLYLFSERRGEVALLTGTPQAYQVRGRFRVAGKGNSWAHPVVSAGRLYLRYGTTLYCHDVTASR